LLNQLTSGNSWDTYAKTIIGRNKGLGHKLREVCPEVDGGLSYTSCVTEAHVRGFQCLKDVEDHPRFQVCTQKPIIKKVQQEFLVADMQWHKEILKCLSQPTQFDTIKLQQGIIDGSRLGPDDDLSDEVANKEIPRPHLKVDRFGYNVEVGANTRQCFYKMRSKVSECSELAKQCPKFRQCYEHPTIKSLKVHKHLAQAKYVKVMDMCLQGAQQLTGITGSGIVDESAFINGGIDSTGIWQRNNVLPEADLVQDYGF